MRRPRTSVQLYTLRDQSEQDLDGTLARIAATGIRHVEVFDFVRRADELAQALERHGLSAPTGHAMLVQTETTSPDGETRAVPSHQETFEAARALGMKYVIDPAVSDWSSREVIDATAAALNRAAATAAGYGVSVGYHNHSWELAETVDGRPALEYFADQLDDSVVLEIDLYWVHIGGVDAPALLQRLGDRVKALHIKDGPTVADPFPADGPFDAITLGQLPAGEGDVPLAECLRAAAGAEYAVIEYDAYDGDIFAGIEASYRFLEGNQ